MFRLLVFVALVSTIGLVAWRGSEPAGAGQVIHVETDQDSVQVEGLCSLREAINAAEFNNDQNGDCEQGSGPDTIEVPAGDYDLNLHAVFGYFWIKEDLDIVGSGADVAIVDAQDGDRIFRLENDVHLVISGLTLRNGNTDALGGGIFNEGDLTLDGVVLTSNFGDGGGGLYNSDSSVAHIIDSTISNNEVLPDRSGGGITNYGLLTIERSAISDNEANSVGGGLVNGANVSPGYATIINSTFANNTAELGGAISNQPAGTLSLLNTTFSGNNSTNSEFSGALQNVDGGVTAQNSLFDDSCGGEPIESLGNNLTATTNDCEMTAGPGDITAPDAILGGLGDNGGPTQTFALLPGSPAIDAGNDAACPQTDQRGVNRPDGNACDIGAFESPFEGATATPTPTPGPGSDTPTPTVTPTPTDASPTATATGVESPTFTPDGTPTPTPTPATSLLWGDADCDGEISSRDNQAVLRAVLEQNPLSQTEPCPDIGDDVDGRTWGDWDCDGEVSSRDNQALLRAVLEQNPLSQTEPCPDIGSAV